MSTELIEARTVMRIGRARRAHLPRVLIEDDAVVIRTRCGINPLVSGWTETYGIPTCDSCIDHLEMETVR